MLIKYAHDGDLCKTECPHGQPPDRFSTTVIMVGSLACKHCPYNLNTTADSVDCAFGTSTLRIMSSAQAQLLANLLKCWVAVDADEHVSLFFNRPCIHSSHLCIWAPTTHDKCALPHHIRIHRDRPWTEQIWGPQ